AMPGWRRRAVQPQVGAGCQIVQPQRELVVREVASGDGQIGQHLAIGTSEGLDLLGLELAQPVALAEREQSLQLGPSRLAGGAKVADGWHRPSIACSHPSVSACGTT